MEDETWQQKLNRLTGLGRAKATAAAGEIEGKVASLREKIEALLHERHEVERSPLTKEETAARSKEALKAGREKILVEALRVHLADVQNQAVTPFHETGLRRGLGEEGKIWKMIFGIIDDGLIDQAAAGLEATGISPKERESKIQKIGRQVADLEKQIQEFLG